MRIVPDDDAANPPVELYFASCLDYDSVGQRRVYYRMECVVEMFCSAVDQFALLARRKPLIIIIIIVYYATKAANIHSYTYKRTVKNKIKFKKTLKFLTYKTH